METMQDKLIREKLNSLDTLPEGYTPSLDSKWELLMAGQPQKKEPKRQFWYAAAAGFLLLLTFGFLFLRSAKKPVTEIIAHTSVPQKLNSTSIPENHQTAPEENVAENDSAERQKTAIASNTVSKIASKNAMVKGLKTPPSDKTEEKLAMKSSSESNLAKAEPNSVFKEQTTSLIAVEAPKSIQKKKARFVEMDFEAEAKPRMVASEKAPTTKMQFKLKILPKTNEEAPAVVQNEKPLRLQHTF